MTTHFIDYIVGSDLNPGDAWGTYALSVADGVTNGTTTLTSATGGFTVGMVGRKVALWSGSTFRAYRTIATYVNGNSVTLNTLVSAYVGLTVRVGGAARTITGIQAAWGASGDLLKVAKSSDPTSCGINSTWTNLSKTITLASALTANIDLCENGWVAGVNVTVTHDVERKEGSFSVKLATGAGVVGAQKLAYKQIALTDFSSYQQISFWLNVFTTALTAGLIQIKLCSDVSGDTPVDTFSIPATVGVQRWVAFTFNKGSALGNSIQSVAIYTTGAYASKNLYFDNVLACKAQGNDALSLTSLIGKNDSNKDWYAIQSINGTTVMIDNAHDTLADEGQGYSGTSETVTLYKREVINTDMVASNSTVVQETKFGGIEPNTWTEVQGGYNTVSDIQDGDTYYSGQNGLGYGLKASNSFVRINKLNFYRYYAGIDVYFVGNITAQNLNNNTYYGIYFEGTSARRCQININNVNNNGNYGFNAQGRTNNNIIRVNNIRNNLSYGIWLDSNNSKYYIDYIVNNVFAGIHFVEYTNNNYIYNLTTSDNTIAIDGNNGIQYLINCLLGESSEFVNAINYANARLFSHKHDQTIDNHKIFTDSGLIVSESSIRHTGSGLAWKISPTGATFRTISYPLDFKIAKIACKANKQVTAKIWLRRSNIGLTLSLVCLGGQISGVDNDISTSMTAIADTWEEVQIQFTPTEAGIVELEVQAYGGSTYNGYVDDMTITQEQ